MQITKFIQEQFPITRKNTLEDALKEKKNNLNIIRLGAAILVIVDHAFPLAARPHWLAARLGFTLGTIAVSTFFFLSGLLIAKSWNDGPNVISFSLKRILRIFPGYWVAIAFCTYVIGPFATTMKISDYFTSRATFSYAAHNALLFPIRYNLPGVFENNKYPLAVNGSIWTLPLEFFAYGCVMVIGLAGILKYRKFTLLLLAGLAYVNFHLVPDGKLIPPTFLLMSTIQLWALLLPFCLGVVCFCYKDKIRLDANYAFVALGAFLLSLGTQYADIGRIFLWSYFLLVFGMQNWNLIHRLTKYGDFSYGIYIYAFPIQQFLYHLQPDMSPYLNILYATPLSYLFGMLSWKLVEAPALKLKKYITKNKEVVLNH